MLDVIGQQYPFEPLVWKPLRISFPEGVKMLHEAGCEVGSESDQPAKIATIITPLAIILRPLISIFQKIALLEVYSSGILQMYYPSDEVLRGA